MHVVGQENVQAGLKGGLGHTGRSISCMVLVPPAASAVGLLTPLCLSQLSVAQRVLNYINSFEVILSLVL